MKKAIKRIIIVLVILFFIFILLDDEEELIENQSTETYTLMVYMCGSNLETDDGFATDDIEEMLDSQLAEEVNLLIYTGGTEDWSDERIGDGKNQIFKVENKDLTLLKEETNKGYMSDPEALEYFIDYSKRHYPADKYALIMWDHGGGAIDGFGYDENNPDESDTLTLPEIKEALKNVDEKLEFIGFDACLMSNFELAYTIKDKAKYLIASEELEPGSGWNYKKLLNQLSKNTAQETKELGTVIVDTYIDSNDWFFGSDATLSVIDLSKMDEIYNELEKFMNDIEQTQINNNQYRQISKALSKTKSFSDGELDTIDLANFALNLNINSSNNLIDKIQEAVVYNKTTSYVENSNGLSLYFPNEYLEYFDNMLKVYKEIGFSKNYINIMKEYTNILAGGHNKSFKINGNTYKTNKNYEQYSWYDNEIVDEYEDYYNKTKLDAEELEIEEKDDGYILHLTEKEWENIKEISYSVWYDDGEGYIDFGIDTNYEYDDDGDLKINFDGNWLAINNNLVYYEVVEQKENFEKGKVPALLNDEEVNLIIIWDEKHPDGYVIGAEPIEKTTLHGKGYIKIKENDKIDFIVDYYDYEGNYDDSYILGDTLTVGKEGLKVSYEWLGDGECNIYYILTDIYNNEHYTEPLIVY